MSFVCFNQHSNTKSLNMVLFESHCPYLTVSVYVQYCIYYYTYVLCCFNQHLIQTPNPWIWYVLSPTVLVIVSTDIQSPSKSSFNEFYATECIAKYSSLLSQLFPLNVCNFKIFSHWIYCQLWYPGSLAVTPILNYDLSNYDA